MHASSAIEAGARVRSLEDWFLRNGFTDFCADRSAVVVSSASVRLRKPIPRTRKLLNRIHQLFDRPRQPVNFPHSDCGTCAGIADRISKLRTIGNRTGHLRGENLLASGLDQRVAPQIEILVNLSMASCFCASL